MVTPCGFKSHLPQENKRVKPKGLTLLFCAEESLEPRVQGLLGAGRLRRSVRREKGPPDLFLNPPHPIFRIIMSRARAKPCESRAMLHSKIRKVIEQGGYPPSPEGITLRTRMERRAMPTYVTYAELIQLGIFIVALIGLIYAVVKGKEK